MTFVVCGLDLTRADRILGIWFAMDSGMDWLCCAAAVGGRVRAAHRFRYYRDNQAFASKDRKSIYHMDGGEDTPANRLKIVESFDEVARMQQVGFGLELFRFAGGTQDEARAWLFAQPFCHQVRES